MGFRSNRAGVHPGYHGSVFFKLLEVLLTLLKPSGPLGRITGRRQRCGGSNWLLRLLRSLGVTLIDFVFRRIERRSDWRDRLSGNGSWNLWNLSRDWRDYLLWPEINFCYCRHRSSDDLFNWSRGGGDLFNRSRRGDDLFNWSWRGDDFFNRSWRSDELFNRSWRGADFFNRSRRGDDFFNRSWRSDELFNRSWRSDDLFNRSWR
ncbi:MAG: hypothetical protein ACI8UO_001163, partial [Verrucomicrobiales bacterium]